MDLDLKNRAIERTIGDITFRSWPVPFDVAVRGLGARLGKIALATGAKALRGDTSFEMLANGLDVVAEHLDDKMLSDLSESFCKASEFVEGDKTVAITKQNMPIIFAGRPLEFVQWIVLGLEANGYASFLAGMKGYASKAMATMTAMETPPAPQP